MGPLRQFIADSYLYEAPRGFAGHLRFLLGLAPAGWKYWQALRKYK